MLITAVFLIQLKIHGQNLESLYKYVPMKLLPVEYLPDDYKGPNAGTEKEIIGDNSIITDTATIFYIMYFSCLQSLPLGGHINK